MSHQIHTYSELRQKIHDDLRLQHPEWIQPNGESPICDSYEARLIETLDVLMRQDPTMSYDWDRLKGDGSLVGRMRTRFTSLVEKEAAALHRSTCRRRRVAASS